MSYQCYQLVYHIRRTQVALTSLWFIPTLRRNIMAKRNRKAGSKKVDFKAAAAHDDTPVASAVNDATKLAAAVFEREAKPKTPATPQAKATAMGAGYARLAGRPSKQAVTAVFGKTGYALSWQNRAIKMGTTPEELCERFKANPEEVKTAWELLTAKKAATA
jgi:hypothetical protein